MAGHCFCWQSCALPLWGSFKNNNNHCIKEKGGGILLFRVHCNFFNCLELSIQCRYVNEMTITNITNSNFPLFLIPFGLIRFQHWVPTCHGLFTWPKELALPSPGAQPCLQWSRSTTLHALILLFVPLLPTPTSGWEWGSTTGALQNDRASYLFKSLLCTWRLVFLKQRKNLSSLPSSQLTFLKAATSV